MFGHSFTTNKEFFWFSHFFCVGNISPFKSHSFVLWNEQSLIDCSQKFFFHFFQILTCKYFVWETITSQRKSRTWRDNVFYQQENSTLWWHRLKSVISSFRFCAFCLLGRCFLCMSGCVLIINFFVFFISVFNDFNPFFVYWITKTKQISFKNFVRNNFE